MKLTLFALMLIGCGAQAQPIEPPPPHPPTPPRATTGMIRPVEAAPAPALAPRPLGPAVEFCRVVMVPSTDEVQNNPMDNGPLAWNVTWNVGGTTQSVIQYALNEWSGIITNTTNRIANPFPITIGFSDFGASSNLIALTSVTYNLASGNLLSATMTFNTRFTYFTDTTPWDDSEFTCTGCTPITDFDLLTVARHELGHAVGFLQTARVNFFIVGTTFDQTRLNIGYDTNTGVGFHTRADVHPSDLMNPSLSGGERRPISLYPSAALVARAFEYEIPMRFVDPDAPGSALTGSANQPFTSLTQAVTSPMILLAPVTHHVPLNFLAAPSGLRSWSTARGGTDIVAP